MFVRSALSAAAFLALVTSASAGCNTEVYGDGNTVICKSNTYNDRRTIVVQQDPFAQILGTALEVAGDYYSERRERRAYRREMRRYYGYGY